MRAIDQIIEWTRWNKKVVLEKFEISNSQISRWKQEKKEKPSLISPYKILDEEVKKVIEYRTSNTEILDLGYRKFTWKRVDGNIAFLTESAVYRVLSGFKLLGRRRSIERIQE
jgi:hypothetical protein